MNSKNILVLILFLIGSFIHAQNYNDVLRLSEESIITNARFLGMGNAANSFSNDLVSGFFNPAGIALLRKGEIDFGFNSNSFNNNSILFNSSDVAKNSSSRWNQIGIVLPVPTSRGSLTFAFGYNISQDFNKAINFNGFNSSNNSMIQDLASYNDDIAYNLALSYPLYDKNKKYIKDTTLINGRLNQKGNISNKGKISNWYFTVGIEIDKDVFLGGTISILNGEFFKVRDYWEEDTKDLYPGNLLLDPSEPKTADFQKFYFRDRLDWDLSGYEFKIGLLSKLNENINVGLSVRFPRVFSIKEVYSIYASSTFRNSFWEDSPPESKIEYDITTPYEYTGGISYKNNNFLVALDAKLIDYASGEFSFGFDKDVRLDKNKEINDLLRTVLNINIGGEYLIPDLGFTVRAGLMYKPSAFKDDPSDFDKKFITFGLGYKLSKKLNFDIAYAYGWWKDFGDNYGSNLSRVHQEINVGNLLTTIKYFF
ncbi:MAG: outer membrane protein transport protein [Melioribacteraceae bacterium]|nr:outer membrane protein transport protein [Melioribacteraceae bacterium]